MCVVMLLVYYRGNQAGQCWVRDRMYYTMPCVGGSAVRSHPGWYCKLPFPPEMKLMLNSAMAWPGFMVAVYFSNFPVVHCLCIV